jgi:hypothetical protein
MRTNQEHEKTNIYSEKQRLPVERLAIAAKSCTRQADLIVTR